jgi:hypothetical protein
MWSFEHTVETPASPAAVWALYLDVPGWPAWDHGLERVDIDGPLAAGTSGRITPVGQDTLPFTVTWAEPGRGFADETAVPGHAIRFRHTLEALAGGGTRITHRIEIDGPAGAQFGPEMVADMPEAMAALAATAERVALASIGG